MAPIPRPQRSTRRRLLTVADAVDHLLRVEELKAGQPRNVDRCVFALKAALNSFVTYSPQGFRYYDSRRVLIPGVSVDLGTVVVSSNVATPSVAPTWPSWVAYGHLHAGKQSFAILSTDATTATMDNMPDGTYTNVKLDQIFIPLPDDFRRRGSLSDGDDYIPIVDVPAGILQSWQDYYDWVRSAASPRVFAAISGDQRFQGELLLAIWPPYAEAAKLSLFYERYPGRIDYNRAGTGQATTSSTTVTAPASTFVDEHVGATINFSNGTSADWTSPLADPTTFLAQRVITAVASGTTATIDAALTDDIGGAGNTFYISDILDVMPGPMTDAFLRLAEYELTRASKSDKAPVKFMEFRQQLEIAMTDDSRYRDSVDDGPFAWSTSFGIGSVTGRPDL